MNIEKQRRNLARQKEQVGFDLKDLLASTEALLRSTASYTGAEIDETRERLRSQIDKAREQAGVWNEAVKERGRVTDTYVREHPWELLGLAAIAGIIAGHWLSGGRQHER
jgi:ElaB/YqjD/DUF883 family membrane-anchored ribosome-binding protein